MNTSIRKGRSMFFGDQSFSRGLSRSGYFNKRESEELAVYGQTFQGLSNGNLVPENEEEAQFVADMKSTEESCLYPVGLWKKYLAAVAQNRVHHSFSRSNGKLNYVGEADSTFEL